MIKNLTFMTKTDQNIQMKKYWEKIINQVEKVETQTIEKHDCTNLFQEISDCNNSTILAELYLKNSNELFSILRKLSSFTNIFKFCIKKEFIIINSIIQSRIFLTYIKLTNSSFKFYKEGELYFNGKQFFKELDTNSFKKLIIKLIFKEKILVFISMNRKIFILNGISNHEFYLNEISIESFENLKYVNEIKIYKTKLKNIIIAQEKLSEIFKIRILDKLISFNEMSHHDKYLGFSISDIKRALSILPKECNCLISAEEGKPLKIQVVLKQLGNSIIYFYFSQHISK